MQNSKINVAKLRGVQHCHDNAILLLFPPCYTYFKNNKYYLADNTDLLV